MILALRFSMKATNFVHDQLASGHKLRVLIMVDTFSRFSPALAPRFTFRGTDVVEVLEGACKEVGLPATIRVDQGSEFVSRALDLWPTSGTSHWNYGGPARRLTRMS